MKLIERVRSKLIRMRRGRLRRGVPYQSQTTVVEYEGNWYEPVILGPSTLAPDCSGPEGVRFVTEVLQKLTPERFLESNKKLYRTGLERFGERWRYADINTVLYGVCKNLRVESYMEIGVRRGRSMAVVAAMCPEARLVGFDMWIPNYVGIENPGPEFVRGELERVGYRGEAEFVSGNSRQTVPQYFRDHPDAYFDVITVDGDHSRRGATIDLKNVIPRLKVGGALVFDDIVNLWHPHMEGVWRRVVERHRRFTTYRFDEVGYGIALAIKQY